MASVRLRWRPEEVSFTLDDAATETSVWTILVHAPGCTLTVMFLCWITDRKDRRAIPHRMEQWATSLSATRQEGRPWIANESRMVAYGEGDLSIMDRMLAAERLAR